MKQKRAKEGKKIPPAPARKSSVGVQKKLLAISAGFSNRKDSI